MTLLPSAAAAAVWKPDALRYRTQSRACVRRRPRAARGRDQAGARLCRARVSAAARAVFVGYGVGAGMKLGGGLSALIGGVLFVVGIHGGHDGYSHKLKLRNEAPFAITERL